MLINALNGLVYGSLLSVLTSGLVLVYGLRRVVNFAHGALYMLGAYVGYSVAMRFGFLPGVVSVVGGLGSFTGAFASAMLPGQIQAFGTVWRAKFQADPTDYEGETYTGMQLIFEAVRKSKSVAAGDVSKAMAGLPVATPFGQVAMRAADRQLELPNCIGRVGDQGGAAAIEVVREFDAASATPAPSPECKL
jgi:hypothetical protein